MPKSRRLSPDQRLSLLAQRRKGVATKELAARYGISERAVRYALATEKTRKIAAHQKDTTIAVRIDGDALRHFDGVLFTHGFSTRSEALRRIIYGAAGFFSPDEHLANEIKKGVSELARVGTNINQIARRLNQAAVMGSPGTTSKAELIEIRELSSLVLELRNDLQSVINRRRTQLQEVLRNVLSDEAGDDR